LTTFVYDHGLGIMVNRDTREPMNTEPVSGPFPTPGVVSDIKPYLSPVSGEYIGGKRAKRADLERHNCIDANDMPTLGGKLKNRKFAEKRGLTSLLAEDAK